MIIKLPTIKRKPIEENGEIVDIVTEKEYLAFDLDTSIHSEYRFQRYFKDTVSDKTLADYASRILSFKPKNSSDRMLQLASLLKIIYCFLESEKVPTYEDFEKLFDFSIAEELLTKIAKILELYAKSAGKN